MSAYVANYHASVTLEVHGDPMFWTIHLLVTVLNALMPCMVSAKGDLQQCANVTR